MDVLKIVNGSILSGFFPKSLKTAVVEPLLKKGNLDPSILYNYRPVANLPFGVKITEKAVSIQLNNFLNTNELYITALRLRC